MSPNGYYAMDYNPIVAALVNAVQEQQGLISSLQQNFITDNTQIAQLAAMQNSGLLTTTSNINIDSIIANTSKFLIIDSTSATFVDAEVTGLLKSNEINTSLITAKSGQDLALKLSDKLGNTKMVVQDSDGHLVFSVDSNGNLNIGGNAQVGGILDVKGKLQLNSDASQAQVGTAKIIGGELTTQINTSATSANSKIFLTLSGTMANPPVLSVTQRADGHFEVSIDSLKAYDTTFDWWVVN